VVFGTVRGAWSLATYCAGAAVGLGLTGFDVLDETSALVTGLWNDFVSWVRDAFVSDVTLPI